MEANLKPVLIDWIENAVSQMRHTDGDANQFSGVVSALRELQFKLHPLIFSNADPETRFIAFFLNAYVDNVSMDLLGDVPDDKGGILQKVRVTLFREIGEKFHNLLDRLRKTDDPVPTLAELVASYATAITTLNYRDLEQGGENGKRE